MTAAPPPTSRAQTTVLWVLRITMALVFLTTGLFKLTGQPLSIATFDAVGLGQWFRYVTGVMEVAGAILVVVPRVSPFGAILMFCVSVGAFVAAVTVLHIDFIHTIVLTVIAAYLIYAQRQRLPFMPG